MNNFMHRHNLPMIRFVKEWNDIWDMTHIYSSVLAIPLRWVWLGIYR